MDVRPENLPAYNLERLSAAAIVVKVRLDRLEADPNGVGQGYLLERLVEGCRILRATLGEVQKSGGSLRGIPPPA